MSRTPTRHEIGADPAMRKFARSARPAEDFSPWRPPDGHRGRGQAASSHRLHAIARLGVGLAALRREGALDQNRYIVIGPLRDEEAAGELDLLLARRALLARAIEALAEDLERVNARVEIIVQRAMGELPEEKTDGAISAVRVPT
jgi:hypothetical protein